MIGIISVALLAAGFFFFLATSIGLIRFPDFYCRMHAAGKGDTLSTLLMLTGLALLHIEHFSGGALLVSLKIMFIAVFIFLTSPTSTHAIARAARRRDLPLWTKDQRR